MKRIDLAKTIIEDEEHFQDEICCYCYHILRCGVDERGVRYIYCPNEMCRNETHYYQISPQ